jgi:hypothetical protein
MVNLNKGREVQFIVKMSIFSPLKNLQLAACHWMIPSSFGPILLYNFAATLDRQHHRQSKSIGRLGGKKVPIEAI